MKLQTYVMMMLMLLVPALSLTAQDKAESSPESGPAPKPEKTEAEKSPFKSEMDKVSYIFGTRIGMNIKSQKLDINLDLFTKGITDILNNEKLALSQAQIDKTMADFQKRLQEMQKKQAQENLAQSKKFLEENKKNEGVVVLPSGLQYQVITPGTGKQPKAADKVKTHYRGTLINGDEFDNSYKRNEPAVFGVNQVVPGWTEALQLMKEGAKWKIFIPSNLAYGEKGRPTIPPNSALIFELELLEVIPKRTVTIPKPPVTKPES